MVWCSSSPKAGIERKGLVAEYMTLLYCCTYQLTTYLGRYLGSSKASMVEAGLCTGQLTAREHIWGELSATRAPVGFLALPCLPCLPLPACLTQFSWTSIFPDLPSVSIQAPCCRLRREILHNHFSDSQSPFCLHDCIPAPGIPTTPDTSAWGRLHRFLTVGLD